MKKRNYKSAIQVGWNIQDIFKLGCVAAIQKSALDNFVVIVNNALEDWFDKNGVKYTEDVLVAYIGDWICEREDGKYDVLTDEEYKKTLTNE